MRFDDFKEIYCNKCKKVQPVTIYCLHYYCGVCNELLGFFPFAGEKLVPCVWNSEGTELIELRLQ